MVTFLSCTLRPLLLIILLGLLIQPCSGATQSATAIATCRSVYHSTLYWSLTGFGPIATQFTTFDGKTTLPLYDQVGTTFIFSGELRPRAGQPAIFEADYINYTTQLGFYAYGSYVLTLPTTNLGLNGIPDIFQFDKSGTVAYSGFLQPDSIAIQGNPVQGQLQKVANSSVVQNTFTAFNSDGTVQPFSGQIHLLYVAGQIDYTRGITNQLTLTLSGKLFGNAESATFTATMPFSIQSANQVNLPTFSLAGPLGLTQVDATTLKRVGTKYSGSIKLSDGNISTHWADFTDWILEVTDNNDANQNGVPDLSDAIPAPPTVAVQPKSQTVTTGQTVTFSVSVSGSAPVQYQWYKNGAAIPGATQSSFSINSALQGDGGNYSALVSNLGGAVSTTEALLTVIIPIPPPTITKQPQPQSIPLGNPITLEIAATGVELIVYHWRKNGIPIPTATNKTFTISNASVSDTGTTGIPQKLIGRKIPSGFRWKTRVRGQTTF